MNQTKKVGVFTLYHGNTNYGATLQAYALQKKINEQGFDACVVDFIPKEQTFSGRLFRLFCDPSRLFRTIRRRLKFVRTNRITIESECDRLREGKISKWEYFCHKYIAATEPIPEKELKNSELTDRFDILLVGSDQVWNPNICSELHFLPFEKKGRKKLAYAASISVPSLTESEKALFIKWLPDFDYITVRENEGKQLLESFLDVKVETVLDPTLLLTSDDWSKLSEPLALRNQVAYRTDDTHYSDESSGYILFTALGTDPSHRRFAMRIAERTGMRIKILSTTLKEMMANRDMAGDELVDVSPNQYLFLVKNASLVITDSFHCMAFAINFHRNFFVLKRNSDQDTANMNSRIYTLLGMLNLEDRLVDAGDADKIQLRGDLYDGVDEKLNSLRQRSEKILSQMLNGES